MWGKENYPEGFYGVLAELVSAQNFWSHFLSHCLSLSLSLISY